MLAQIALVTREKPHTLLMKPTARRGFENPFMLWCLAPTPPRPTPPLLMCLNSWLPAGCVVLGRPYLEEVGTGLEVYKHTLYLPQVYFWCHETSCLKLLQPCLPRHHGYTIKTRARINPSSCSLLSSISNEKVGNSLLQC